MLQRRIGLPYPAQLRRAFTLIELLIVIACIAILAALLFPVLTNAKQTALRAKCASNLNQLGRAFQLYSLDWNGWWPSPGGLVGDRGYWSQSGFGGINAYVRQRGLGTVWCCPLLTEWHGQFPPRSYSMNSYLRTPCDAEYLSCISFLKGIHVGRIGEPSRTILLYEGIPRSAEFQDKAYTEDQVYYVYRCANWSWARGYWPHYAYTIDSGQPWHGKDNNYLYCDGHIIARGPYRYQGVMRASFEEEYQWYVDKAPVRRRFGRGAAQ